ncbi:MAG: alkaline phosphatase family protein, partial [Candidatus Omnitrophica bacterium]|nr:alkaline phosphatase family protein [Candidatus Omnitrophota bacterium]
MIAYLDPGTGFNFLKEPFFLLPFIAGFFSIFVVFFKNIMRFFKRFKILVFLSALFLIIGGLIMVNISDNIPKYKKILILAIDGMDPVISDRLMAEGELKNFSRLKREGYYSRLKTVYPAESSVVWASFATGLFPQQHGIFDFIMRNPENYALYLGLSDIKTKTRNLRLGKFNIPVKREAVAENILQEKCFWDLLSEKDVPVSVYFHPHTFPARAVTGRMISGMGVPDIYGTMGRYYYYTEDSSGLGKDIKGQLVTVARKGNKIKDFIYGPKVESKQLRVPLEVILSDNVKQANFRLPGSEFNLKEGQWSDFYKITFKSGFAKKISAIAKFYLKSVQP